MATSPRVTARVGVRTSAQTPVVEEIVPNSGWTEDSAGHYLLVDLPEFSKEEVKLQVDSNGRIIVTGERQANERKRVHFQLTFPVPVDSDMDKIEGKFDGGILYVTVPKRNAKENKESETEKAENGSAVRAKENDSHEPNTENEGRDPSLHDNHTEQEEKRNENAQGTMLRSAMLRSALEVLRKNKGIVITAVVAFSLGLLVSHQFQSSTAP
ncbi:22.0 kDa heat shock protein-like [Gastrolobium bilobum]|uniref:22.0 kDa heat shock protein-like n=1 Tax=Gastrolobium bilobum TaxID=150636 RepID=UPI002AAFCB55|nr:22.0 kDa heat shock protein-like [Gastrolobium bilobum]